MASVRIVTTAMVLISIFAVGMIVAVPLFDGILPVVLGFDLGGMGSTVEDIHAVPVKWMIPVGVFSVLGWAVFRILREERQTVR